MTDEPIQEQEYLAGVKVVDIGDLRVSRGLTRRPVSSCRHGRMVYDQNERRIWCKDCERDVDPFDAFVGLIEYYSGALKTLERDRKQVEEAKAFQLRSRAAKAMDEAWRSRTMVPMCPHCSNGLFPEHFANGCGSMLGRDYAEMRLRKAKQDKPA
ncbi:hypothetical protein [Aureimonas sp. ME7]|uniref:hypothetical protein n=1 Tax=Aureimonas sp. ME7 TaxID=2744252 RepID=UPI0015FB06DC|nr:hypothetical protein [Aureimonas sp. ME7]